MFAKFFIFVLTYILTVANFVFLVLPLWVLTLPLYLIFHSFFEKAGWQLGWLFLAAVSFLTCVYMILDLLFGFTQRGLMKGMKPVERMSVLRGHEQVIRSFEWLKGEFNAPNARLFVDPNMESVNAFAIGGMRHQYVAVTMGLLMEIHERSANESQFVDGVRAILGHELSHLVNKDFLPGLLAASSELATRHVARLLRLFLMGLASIVSMLPFGGIMLYNLVVLIYNVNLSLTYAFFRWVFMPLYRFVQKWFGRSMEYRCDRDSARVVGGRSMAFALSSLGEGAYFSLFSSHPRTQSRINHVKDVRPVGERISPSLFNSLANGLSMFALVVLMYYASYQVEFKTIHGFYMSEIYTPVLQKWNYLVALVKSLISTIKGGVGGMGGNSFF